ncbi:limonoid UDP-glucosyltransferase [Amborella trichopoda]|uniref:Glycosyltransferase n=1 Tax=Amborella trichopoda TaxID=13333 RepID=U5DBW3_AMBTC|nr:limonoid UDP-glucosyltransferase [Amborella trichopoda]ERN17903.1 hypothetical protein AMTR_s00047p00226150 [Amborella trichopoda]|eukprot:XP_006856436.3 limonoid UDP-glucosyltransferase [Amborella trichopoda]
MEMGSETKHVMLVCYAAQGHINPVLQFAGRLASRGISITVATAAIGRQRILKDGDKATAFEADGNIKFEFFSDGSDPLMPIKDLDDCLGRLEREGPESLAGLVEDLRVQGRKVTYMVTTPFTPWVIDLAKGLGVPCSLLWIQCCAVYGYYYRVLHRNRAEMEVPLTFPGLPHLKPEDFPTLASPSSTYNRFPLLLTQLYEKLGDVKMVLGNSFNELEPEEIWFAEGLHLMKLVGPLIPQALLGCPTAPRLRKDMWVAPSNCLSWLDSKPEGSVVYVSLGSVSVLPPKQTEEMAWGLKISRRAFIWVVKPPENSSETGLPEGFLEGVEGQGIVVPWCPQVEVLSHPSLACFLTHCGWNSTLETVAAGVPVIAFPQWTDQPTNAMFLVDVLRVGVRLKVDLVTRDEVERCIAEVTDGEKATEMKKAAARCKEMARASVAKCGSSERNMQAFVDDIMDNGPIHEPKPGNGVLC